MLNAFTLIAVGIHEMLNVTITSIIVTLCFTDNLGQGHNTYHCFGAGDCLSTTSYPLLKLWVVCGVRMTIRIQLLRTGVLVAIGFAFWLIQFRRKWYQPREEKQSMHFWGAANLKLSKTISSRFKLKLQGWKRVISRSSPYLNLALIEDCPWRFDSGMFERTFTMFGLVSEKIDMVRLRVLSLRTTVVDKQSPLIEMEI
jgi:hypothetical protein